MSAQATTTSPATARAPISSPGSRATPSRWPAKRFLRPSARSSSATSRRASPPPSTSPRPARRPPSIRLWWTSMLDNGPSGSGAPTGVAGRTLRYVDAIRDGLAQALDEDPRVFVFGLDVDDHKGIQGSTVGLPQRFGADRVFGTPLSEEGMTGIAIGAAMAGLRPVHVHIRMDFLMLCMNQLVNMAAKSRYMYGGSVSCPMVVRAIIGKSWGQGAQHSQGLHSMFMHVPGLKVVAPSNPHDVKGCLIEAIRDPDPVIFVEHRLLYDSEAPVPDGAYTVPFGKARVCRRGDDVTLVGISAMLPECLGAAKMLATAGIAA